LTEQMPCPELISRPEPVRPELRCPELIVYLDGDYKHLSEAHVHVEDRGFNFGDSLYEVVRAYRGMPFGLSQHLARLEAGAREIELNFGLSSDELSAVVMKLLTINGLNDALIYIQVTRGTAPRDHFFPSASSPTVLVIAKPFDAPSKEEQLRGQSVLILPDLRHRYCAIKSTSLLANVLACEEARRQGFDEAVLEDNGIVTEGARTSAFIVRGGSVVTHPLGSILPGITRNFVLELCEEARIPVEQRPFTVDELLKADEVFLTDSVCEVTPIIKVGSQAIGDGKAGPVTRALAQRYTDKVAAHCQQSHSLSE